MKPTFARLAELIASAGFEELETDTLEIKNVPADAGGWTQRHKGICAFLNTRGGIVIFGVKEEGTGAARKYVFTGWQPHAEPTLKEIPKRFTARDGTPLDLGEAYRRILTGDHKISEAEVERQEVCFIARCAARSIGSKAPGL